MDDVHTADREIVDGFHRLYYDAPEQTIYNTHWLGVAAQKYPTDLWVYQELVYEVRPDFIVETGTYWGGSALFLASICELVQHGHVVSIDVRRIAESQRTNPTHRRITYVEGSSIAPEVVDKVKEMVKGAASVMVILDSDHGREHVLNELKVWSDVVTEGSYLIVEDTNVNGHPVLPDFGPGPMEAVDLFLSQTEGFTVDRSREKYLLTANPRGFLRKVGQGSVEGRMLRAEETADELRQALGQLARERDDLLAVRLPTAEAEAARLRALLDDVTGSASWRVTAPARALARVFRGAK